METNFLENRTIKVKALFRANGEYRFFWRNYNIKGDFEFVKKGSYGFVYLSRSSKQQVVDLIKENFKEYGRGAVIMNDLCVSTGGTNKHFEINVEILACNRIMRRLKTDNLLNSL